MKSHDYNINHLPLFSHCWFLLFDLVWVCVDTKSWQFQQIQAQMTFFANSSNQPEVTFFATSSRLEIYEKKQMQGKFPHHTWPEKQKKKKCQRHNITGCDCLNSTENLCGNKFLRRLQPKNLAQASNFNFQKLTKVWVWNLAETLTSKTWSNFRFKISRSFIFSKHGHMDQARKWSIRPGSDERNEIFQTEMILDFRGRIWDVAKCEELEKLPPWF